ncbi:tissue specific transplantation antigen [Baffinella frigidus]|nr:tissue specific transplantation antigen [Cryptophyta sp. CCMP2293]
MASDGAPVVLVTGGTGLVGSGLRWQVEENNYRPKGAKFVFLSSKDADLRDLESTRAAFQKHKPTHVIHLAARVGGLFKNLRSKVEMMVENININQNVLACAHEVGADRVVSMTSTCVFPDKIVYPITEDTIHDGPPHPSNEGYAYAKRMVEVLSRAYNDQHGRSYFTVVPTNVYGPHDNYSIEVPPLNPKP